MATGKFSFGRADLPYAFGVVVLVGLGAFLFAGGILAQPYPTFGLCGGVAGGFVVILGWIRARSTRITFAKKVPKVTAQKIPKQLRATTR